MGVAIAIADSAPVDDERIVEKGAFPILSRLQFAEELPEKADVELIDLRHFLNPFGVISVVRQGVVAVGDINFRVGSHAAFAPDHHRRDSGDVGAKRGEL